MPETVTDLNQHQCIAGTSAHWQFKVNGRVTTHRISNPRIRCNSGIGIRDAALKHLGIIQLPDYYVAEDIENGTLKTVLPGEQVDDDGIWAVYPQTRHVSTKVRLLIDYLIANLYH